MRSKRHNGTTHRREDIAEKSGIPPGILNSLNVSRRPDGAVQSNRRTGDNSKPSNHENHHNAPETRSNRSKPVRQHGHDSPSNVANASKMETDTPSQASNRKKQVRQASFTIRKHSPKPKSIGHNSTPTSVVDWHEFTNTTPDKEFHKIRIPCDDSELTDKSEIDNEARNMSSWRDNKSLAECNSYMLEHQLDYDVNIMVGSNQDSVYAHSYVLVSRSANMEQLLEKQKDRISKILVIPNIQLDVFEPILKYFYTDDIELTISLAMSIIPVTRIVGNRDLMFVCFSYLMSEISSDNCCKILELAHELNVKHVYQKTCKFINSNAEEVLMSEEFTKLCTDCVGEIVKSDDLKAEELSVYNALIRWSDAQTTADGTSGGLSDDDDEQAEETSSLSSDEQRRQKLGKLLYHVRFVCMDTDQFTQHISKSEVLSPEEKLTLYQVKYNDTTVLPPDFDKQPRNKRTHVGLATEENDTTSKSQVWSIAKENKENLPMEAVHRFGEMLGTWQMKGPDAIRFTVSQPVKLWGVQIYGPKEAMNQFKVDISVFDEKRQEIGHTIVDISPLPDVFFYDVMLDEPLDIKANETYTVQLIIKCKATHCGVEGQVIVDTDTVKFEFKNSNRSFNGTDISIGQIPAILYSKSENH